ncbi:MAG: SLBB domain-containing protein [Betaproteobacteria bacterium]
MKFPARGVWLGAGLLLAALTAFAQTQQPVMPTDTPARLPTQAVPTITNNGGAGNAGAPGARDGRDSGRDLQAGPERGRKPSGQGGQSGDYGSQDTGSSRAERMRDGLNGLQTFLATTAGLELPVFGAAFFQDVPSTFSPVDNVPVTPDYLIGPGDEIVIRAWGAVEIDYRAVVDRTGAISLPRVGVVNLAGVRYQNLAEHLRRSVARVFRNFELTASLGQLRSIQVYVVGQARRPGAYTVSSLSTLVNAIFAAGGPGASGSMRAVQLKRAGRTVTEMDLYELLVRGDKGRDAALLPGDVIFFPPVGALAAVTGSVNTPAVFELKAGETLADALRYAGGLSTLAEGEKVTVERIDNRQIREVAEFPLDAPGLARPLRDGDVVTVHAIVPRFDNSVSLRGNVAQPRHFAWRAGMRVRDLVPERAALLSRDYWVGRYRLPNQEKEAADRLERDARDTRDRADGRRAANGAGTGAQRSNRPGAPPDSLDRRTADELRPPEGEVNWEYAVIERLNRQDYSTSLVAFHLGKAVIDGDPEQNLLLEPGDVITIFSKTDVRVPTASQTRYIRLEGEVAQAGVFQILPGETLRQVVARVGGLSPNAYLFAAELNRESTRRMQQEKLNDAADRLERDVQRNAAVRAQNTMTPDEAQSIRPQLEAQQALIARLRTIKAPGRVVLEVPPGARDIKDLPDLPLEDGDRLYVPPAPATVSVFGAVYNENAFLHRSGKKVDDYLRQAGGPTKNADDDAIYLARADGSVVSKSQGGGWGGGLGSVRVMPGDSVVVPEKLDRTEFRRALRDWTQIFSQFGMGIAALRVLKGL